MNTGPTPRDLARILVLNQAPPEMLRTLGSQTSPESATQLDEALCEFDPAQPCVRLSDVRAVLRTDIDGALVWLNRAPEDVQRAVKAFWHDEAERLQTLLLQRAIARRGVRVGLRNRNMA